MNVIFITLSDINDIKHRGIYADLMRKFRNEGHTVYIVSSAERRTGKNTQLLDVEGVYILKVCTLNIQKTTIVEKGIGTLMMEVQFKRAIKKHLGDARFDLILYSTPPITFTNVVKYLKKKESTGSQLSAAERHLPTECGGYWDVWREESVQLVLPS